MMIIENKLIFFTLALFLFCLIMFFIKEKYLKLFTIKDYPSKRKIHKFPVPLIGGFIFLSYSIAFILLFSLFFSFKDYLNIFLFYSAREFFFFLIIILSFFCLGVIDDKFRLDNFKKIFLYFFLIYLLINYSGILQIKELRFESFSFLINKSSIIFTSFAFLVIFIVMSLYDGINLQLGSFYFLLFLYISIILKSLIVLLFFLPPLIIFLILNNNNKAFLGESGVNFLSIFAITLLLKIYNLNYFSIHFDINYLISIFFIPLIDSIRLFFFRILYFGAPFRADKNHIHHKLIKNLGFKFTSVILVSQLLFILILIYFQINSFYLILVNLFFYFYILFRIDGKKSNYNKS